MGRKSEGTAISEGSLDVWEANRRKYFKKEALVNAVEEVE